MVFALCLLMLAPPGASAQERRQLTDETPTGVVGDVIDITGFMERPRGDTRIAWDPPGGFDRSSDVQFGRMLWEEVLTPVSRQTLERRMDIERELAR